MRGFYSPILLVMSLMFATTVQAATVKVVEPEVYVGGADGYKAIPGTAQAHVGASVMAGEFGVGQVIYENGCVVTVRPGTVVAIEAQSSCKAAHDWSTNLDPASGGLSTGHILLGAAIAGGIGVGIYALTQSDDKPASR